MQDVRRTSQPSGRQKVLIGLAIGLVALVVVVLATLRLMREENASEEPTEAILPGPAPVTPGESTTITLFFVDPLTSALVEERRTLFLPGDPLKKIQRVMAELTKGPVGELITSVPQGTKLNSVFLDERGIVYLDFSTELQEQHPSGTTAERLTVEAIVRTVLANFQSRTRRVQILINGTGVSTLAGHLDISRPLSLPGAEATIE